MSMFKKRDLFVKLYILIEVIEIITRIFYVVVLSVIYVRRARIPYDWVVREVRFDLNASYLSFQSVVYCT
jgi:uncharacterized membrane protein (DUF485 family)